jgi:hypothetical protein
MDDLANARCVSFYGVGISHARIIQLDCENREVWRLN